MYFSLRLFGMTAGYRSRIAAAALFGLLAVELAVELTADVGAGVSHVLAAVFSGHFDGIRLSVFLRDADRLHLKGRGVAWSLGRGDFLLLCF